LPQVIVLQPVMQIKCLSRHDHNPSRNDNISSDALSRMKVKSGDCNRANALFFHPHICLNILVYYRLNRYLLNNETGRYFGVHHSTLTQDGNRLKQEWW
jgi:hypothetical protein